MSVYLIDGYNLLHQMLGTHEATAGRPGKAGGGAPGARQGRGAAPLTGARPHPGGAARPDAARPGDGTGQVADLDDERRRLLDRIASYMGGTSDRAIVVFDSRAPVLQKSESATAQVDVYFGSFTQSADSIIEREVYALTPGENVIVVSSDYHVQKTIFRPNVVRVSSRQFAGELQAHTKRIANRENCITMSHRIEERIPSSTLERLARLRDELSEEPPTEGRPPGSG